MRAEIEDAAEAGTQVVGVCRAKTETKASAIAGARTRRAIMGIADRGVPEVPIHQRICGIIVQPVRVLNLRICFGKFPQRSFGHAHRRGIDKILVPERQIRSPAPTQHLTHRPQSQRPRLGRKPSQLDAPIQARARDIWRLRPWLPARAGWRRSGDNRSHVLVPVTLPMDVSLSSLTGSHWNLATSL